MTLTPLGEETVLAYLPDEAAAVQFAHSVRAANPAWLHDVVPSYASVGVFFDASLIRTAAVIAWLKMVAKGEITPGFPPATTPPTSGVAWGKSEGGADFSF